MSVVARIYIVRHGETDANRNGIFQGHQDTRLNDVGLEQARMTAEALERVPFGVAYSSDLERAAKTAEIILSKHPGVELKKYPELRERYLGDLEGKKIGQYTGTDGSGIPKNAESTAEFSTRVSRWWKRNIIQRHVHGASSHANSGSAAVNVLVVSHGGAIGTLVLGLVGSRKVRCGKGVAVGRCMNASVSVVELGEDGAGVLVSFGDTTHLEGELVAVNVDEV
ncbi:phosphoglycerate mutase-like protein [Cristinia sonorae]|uniref:Phosphoglycerate mutase-like protein n=1 Tax=Cristinia sonorae TaxID=1940300 RepID=A0A8K0UMN1_9AGAR|nr:phosphoglycerate mutase-like protein [Cristinia sonorae]